MYQDEPFFITGCPKSGTSLIVNMLNNHPDFLLEYEFHVSTHLVDYYYKQPIHPLIARDYKTGDPLSQTRNVELFEHGEFTKLMAETFGKLHRGYHTGVHWGSAARGLIGYPASLLRLWPKAKFVMVLRDPRDVFTSMSHTNWDEQPWSQNIEGFAKEYNYYFTRREAENIVVIRYEDICQYPEILYERVGVPMPENPLKNIGYVYEHRTEPQPPRLHKDVPHETPEDKFYKRTGRWQRELSAEIAEKIVELCSGVFEQGFYTI